MEIQLTHRGGSANADSSQESPAVDAGGEGVSVAYKTKLGKMMVGKVEAALDDPIVTRLRGKVDLILTSPPFPLVRKKKYGNETGEEYLTWLESLAPKLASLLSPTGSIVVELGNAWEKGAQVMSTLSLEALLAFKKSGKLHLCQHVICHNPARLPSPAAWVTVRRVRLKDSFTHVWWMSRTEHPKADNREVLSPYSKSMKSLLSRKSYNSGKRPSGHVISGEGFLADQGGAISPSVVGVNEDSGSLPESLLTFTGTAWDAKYREYCLANNHEAHPARMAASLAAFFIKFLTNKNDLVFDPFGGSNTTGAAAEELGRRWVVVEANPDYVAGSKGRFSTLLE